MSVIVPFAGSGADAEAMLDALGRLRLRAGDEVIVADNSPTPVVPDSRGGVRVVAATDFASSYYARNVGAEAAANDWFLFMDADCVPAPDLLDRYFQPPPPDDTGALAGEVLGSASQGALTARYARSRGHLRQRDTLEDPTERRMAVTASLLVRRAALDSVGGFQEGVRSGGDADLSWRLADAGWEMDYRGEAKVEHRHREDARALARQAMRIGAGRAWTSRRHEGIGMPPVARPLARAVAGVVTWLATLRFERAAFKALDGLWVSAEGVGALRSNGGRPLRRTPAAGLVVMLDEFPNLTETFVLNEIRALERAGVELRVEAASRPERPNWRDARGIDVTWWEDDGIARKLLCTLWLACTRPLAVLSDLRDRRRWSREERPWRVTSLAPAAWRVRRARHIHVHFAAAAALNALRISRLMGVSYSLTAHAYDIFQVPANLAEKLEQAAFSTSGCDYNVDYLRRLAPGAAERIHRIVMGIDTHRFRRVGGRPDARVVLAVGRLVEKKGFADLVDAAALLVPRNVADRVEIVGEGPLHDPLLRRIEAAGLTESVVLAGPASPAEVRAALQRASLLVMPSVVAADGDRDSMPVVVKEALAMEVPVVATREVGLPEVVRDDWGRLVAPHDPEALAAAIEELLALGPEELARMGAAGREFVIQSASVDRETAALMRLLSGPHSSRAG